MFPPLKIKYSTDLLTKDLDKTAALNHIKAFVDKHKGENITVTDDSLTFTVSIFGWSWDFFCQIEKGVFTIENDKLSFEFSMYRMFIFTAIMCLFIGYEAKSIDLGIFFFLFIFGANCIVAIIRYKTLIETLSKEVSV